MQCSIPHDASRPSTLPARKKQPGRRAPKARRSRSEPAQQMFLYARSYRGFLSPFSDNCTVLHLNEKQGHVSSTIAGSIGSLHRK